MVEKLFVRLLPEPSWYEDGGETIYAWATALQDVETPSLVYWYPNDTLAGFLMPARKGERVKVMVRGVTTAPMFAVQTSGTDEEWPEVISG